MKKKDEIENVKPIVITDGESGNEYTLEFNRETVCIAESRGLNINDGFTKQMTTFRELFYCSFLMHHPKITKAETDHILFDCIGGLDGEMCNRLGMLFGIPYRSLLRAGDETKNPKWTVRL